jgi:hypothetical protein
MSGDEEWMRVDRRLEESLEEAAALIRVGEEGWLKRFEKVASCVTVFENRGGQVVMQSLVWHLGSEGATKGLDCGESVAKMSEVMEDLRRKRNEEEERGEEVMKESATVYRERRSRRLVEMVASVLTVMEDVLIRM